MAIKLTRRERAVRTVAAAVLEYLNKSGIDIFADDDYYPNKAVFRKVLHQLRKRG